MDRPRLRPTRVHARSQPGCVRLRLQHARLDLEGSAQHDARSVLVRRVVHRRGSGPRLPRSHGDGQVHLTPVPRNDSRSRAGAVGALRSFGRCELLQPSCARDLPSGLDPRSWALDRGRRRFHHPHRVSGRALGRRSGHRPITSSPAQRRRHGVEGGSARMQTLGPRPRPASWLSPDVPPARGTESAEVEELFVSLRH